MAAGGGDPSNAATAAEFQNQQTVMIQRMGMATNREDTSESKSDAGIGGAAGKGTGT